MAQHLCCAFLQRQSPLHLNWTPPHHCLFHSLDPWNKIDQIEACHFSSYLSFKICLGKKRNVHSIAIILCTSVASMCILWRQLWIKRILYRKKTWAQDCISGTNVRYETNCLELDLHCTTHLKGHLLNLRRKHLDKWAALFQRNWRYVPCFVQMCCILYGINTWLSRCGRWFSDLRYKA